jgi:hypothetical protein
MYGMVHSLIAVLLRHSSVARSPDERNGSIDSKDGLRAALRSIELNQGASFGRQLVALGIVFEGSHGLQAPDAPERAI